MELSNQSFIKTIFDSHDTTLEQILNRVVQRVGEILNVDRCFIGVRDPLKERCLVAFVWGRPNFKSNEFSQANWVEEESFVDDDPLYKVALACQSSIYIEDVETTSPEILNRDFESRFCGHRAFIHGHIVQDGVLWGTLEPCVFDHPRQWTEDEHIFIETLLPLLANYVKEYVTKLQIGES
ncbi:unnamed protein product [Rotaria socialis]|uniref:GAF domain-containing protein n=2 Tax=Rotaria socialis TaxID=392032 RepID=A0A817WTC3_9BILA|nr:unnamed protein product [Rotaria socialis]CAF3237523.1 unnamed protein product [Rotaria socialis]CAF3359294.1 unnamed protein product [Rotaria socialis]CAF3523641.1 unnamed protein product [Rotaria socialis]CAF3542381.1 unnamed protein product [Rotaria socialis]